MVEGSRPRQMLCVQANTSLWSHSWTDTLKRRGVIRLDVGEGSTRPTGSSDGGRKGQYVYITVSERES